MAIASSITSRFNTISFLSPIYFTSRRLSHHHLSPTIRLQPLVFVDEDLHLTIGARRDAACCFLNRLRKDSLNDSSPNWGNRPHNEIFLDGCDYKHWLVVMEKPDDHMSRDEIIDSYIRTLAKVVGSEEEARMKIYSVSTKHYFAFGALVPEEVSCKMKALPGVRWVLPDSYLDVKKKNYGGEPFINGKAVPYDPKYHEEWVHNSTLVNGSPKRPRSDRPRSFDRSRNFERRREKLYIQPFENRGVPLMPNLQNGTFPIQPKTSRNFPFGADA